MSSNASNTVRFNIRDFTSRHSQLHHVSGITYTTKHDKWHGWSLTISISRDILSKIKWCIGTRVDIEWDRCRMYLIKKDDGTHQIRLTHHMYTCHPQIKIPGRFVGCIKCMWNPNMKLPKVVIKTWCEDIRTGTQVTSFKLPWPKRIVNK